ncbi:hypothetical protein RhiirA4_475399 [Rhizophagus irregularis]|uniref:Uncharacterized protein n=1 Tax=Rhizophagus irregularis TaxID=588596 RepID=A0A2I1HA49_9GLOM|nr:hypothetical protein RhiirA4_475399 [Rhizophagus irregularis]
MFGIKNFLFGNPRFDTCVQKVNSYGHTNFCPGSIESDVELARIPCNDGRRHESGLLQFAHIYHLRSEVNQLLEAARKDKFIKSSLESSVELYVNSPELLHLLQNHDLKSIFTTSDATISSSLEMIENCSFDIY